MKNLLNIPLILILLSTSLWAEENCPNGQEFSSTLNRCVIPEMTFEMNEKTDQCKDKSGDAYKECFMTTAEGEYGEKDKYIYKDQKGSKTINAAMNFSIAAVTFYVLLSKDSNVDTQSCKNGSLYLLGSGAGVAALTEIIASTAFKLKSKSIEKKYLEGAEDDQDKKNLNDTMVNNQEAAFDALIKIEGARKASEKIRRWGHLAATGIYTAAGLLAMVESNPFSGNFYSSNGSCKDATTSLDLFNPYKNELLLPEFLRFKGISKLTSAEIGEIILREIVSKIGVGSVYAGKNNVFLPVGDGDDDEMDIGDSKKFHGYDVDEDGNLKLDEVVVESNKKETPQAPNLEGEESNIIDIVKKTSESKDSAVKKVKETLKEAVNTPWVRVVVASGMAVYSGVLAKGAKHNIQVAENRIELLKELKAGFSSIGDVNLGQCDESERSDSKKPICFCYLESGNPDPQKENLSVCQRVYKKFEGDLRAKRYSMTGTSEYNFTPPCVGRDGKTDTKCECRKKRTCLNIAPPTSVFNSSMSSMMKPYSESINKLTNGNLNTADLNTSDLEKRNTALNRRLSGMIKKDKKLGPKINKASKDYIGGLPKLFRKSGAQRNNPLASAYSGSSSVASLKNPTKALKEIVDKSKENELNKVNTGFRSGGNIAQDGSSSDDDFNFDLGGGEKGGVVVDNTGSAMKKNFKYTGDINKSNNNLFKILSMRYKRSGLRRLMGGEDKIQADFANEREINDK